jgi:glycosyltransferase involved in cell wall biosynthesis
VIAISIVMPCHNRAIDLLDALRSYDNQRTTEPFELIAVDDASTDETYSLLRSYEPSHYRLRVEHLERNQGPAAARNRGIAAAGGPLVLFVGDDILPGPDFVGGHLAAHDRLPAKDIAILGRVEWARKVPQNTLMAHIDGVGAEQFSYYYLKDGQEYDFRHFYTCNISLKRDLLLSLDRWFDTDFPYPAFEDAELSYRLAHRGMRIIYSSALLAEHCHYHTIWSFAARQQCTGLMAWLITRKHPAIAGRILRAQFGRVLSFLWQPGAFPTPEQREWLEGQALHLASFYEWQPHKLVDGLYRQVLDYFFYKGLIEAIYGRTRFANRVHGVHGRNTLVPALQWFVASAVQAQVPLPEGYTGSILKRLNSLAASNTSSQY